MTKLTATPGQTVGPFFHYAMPYEKDNELVPPGRADALRLYGTVYDGDGQPIPDAILELWQTDAEGNIPRAEGTLKRDGWTFTGFGRASTNADGVYSFTTVEPGPAQDGKPAFFSVIVFARGLLNRLFTRAYVPPAQGQLLHDALLGSLTEAERETLIVTRETENQFRFDVRMQGEGETVFLSFPNDPAEQGGAH